jgi:hypothetical protein
MLVSTPPEKDGGLPSGMHRLEGRETRERRNKEKEKRTKTWGAFFHPRDRFFQYAETTFRFFLL